MPKLSIIVATRDRPETVAEFRRRLETSVDEASFEWIVVDGSEDDTTGAALMHGAEALGNRLRYIHRPGLPAPTARNVGIDAAESPACLFMNDDCWPRSGLLARHVAFHRAHPEHGAAMIGRTAPFWPYEPTPFERWLEASGFRYRYEDIADHHNVGWGHFLTYNASAKLTLLRRVGGFDERFEAGFEDNELGLRLERAGMRLRYDAEAVAEHFHPAGLVETLTQFRRYGRGRRLLNESRSEEPPRRPGTRHRLAAACLAVPYAAGARSQALRQASWRFLCVEAFREGYWDEPEPPTGVRVGAPLARIACADPAARLPVHAALPRDADSANRSVAL